MFALSRRVKALIPTYEPCGLDARIYPHWKDASCFTLVEFDKEKIYNVKAERLASDDLIINLVRREGVGYVIALSLSVRAVELLNKVGVTVLTGNVKTVREAIEHFRNKKLYVLKVIKTRM